MTINLCAPTVRNGIFWLVAISGTAWFLSGLILESPLFLRILIAIVLANVELGVIFAVMLAKEYIAEYSGILEDEREE